MMLAGKWRFSRNKKKMWIYSRIGWHLAVVMQFQVQGQTLCLFLPLITKTLVCCWIQLLWRETKFNSPVFVTRVLCLLHKSRRNKGCFLLNFNFENVGPISGFSRCKETTRLWRRLRAWHKGYFCSTKTYKGCPGASTCWPHPFSHA